MRSFWCPVHGWHLCVSVNSWPQCSASRIASQWGRILFGVLRRCSYLFCIQVPDAIESHSQIKVLSDDLEKSFPLWAEHWFLTRTHWCQGNPPKSADQAPTELSSAIFWLYNTDNFGGCLASGKNTWDVFSLFIYFLAIYFEITSNHPQMLSIMWFDAKRPKTLDVFFPDVQMRYFSKHSPTFVSSVLDPRWDRPRALLIGPKILYRCSERYRLLGDSA